VFDANTKISANDVLELLEETAEKYPEDIFRPPGPDSTPDAYSAHAIRWVLGRLEDDVRDMAVKVQADKIRNKEG